MCSYQLTMFNYRLFPQLIKEDQELTNAVFEYTRNRYKDINNYLRDPNSMFRFECNNYVIEIDKIMKMYQQYIKENGIDEKLETYRKIKMSPEFQKRLYKMLDSGIYVDEAFMSTSIHNTAELEFDLLMTIDANYSDGAFIAPLSAIEGESEFLIDRNIPFVIEDYSEHASKKMLKIKRAK